MSNRAAEASMPAPSPYADMRPLVAVDTGNKPLWLGMGAIAVLGLLLFVGLEARREELKAPSTKVPARDTVLAAETRTPSLYVPEDLRNGFGADAAPVMVRVVPRTSPPLSQVPARPFAARSIAPVQNAPPQSFPSPTPTSSPTEPTTTPASDIAATSDSPIILDLSLGDVETASTAPGGSGQTGTAGAAVATRTPAIRQGSRPLVVPQGTLISAVLETALDSTQPGQARALIGSNITSRRGERILIPRGSRLFGSYQGELAAGQNRILVQWNRLVRPDGVTVAIDSPATDRLGRAGIKGRVNSHFFERLGGALLQSAIDTGTILASRSAYDSPVFIAIPGRLQGVASDLIGPPPKPSITVRPGTRISVFVVRDLDFSDVEGR